MAYRDRLPMPTAVTASEYLQPVGSPSTETQHLQPRVSTSCEVMSPHGTLHCTITEPRASQDSEGVNGYLVLVNAPPFADSTTPPLAGLAEALSVGTVRVDLTGCGRSSGEPIANSVNRDADDIRAVIEFLRHGRSVEQLKARARGARPNAEPSDAVLGILGIGGGGTAAVRYAALFPDESLHVCTVSARVTHSFALRGTFTWKRAPPTDSQRRMLPLLVAPARTHALMHTRADCLGSWRAHACDGHRARRAQKGGRDRDRAAGQAHARRARRVGRAAPRAARLAERLCAPGDEPLDGARERPCRRDAAA